MRKTKNSLSPEGRVLRRQSIKTLKTISVIGGGKGIAQVLKGLKNAYRLSAIVSMADDGGSTGILRKEFGILPPGDIRRALVALGDEKREALKKLFEYRFKKGEGLTGHNLGNLIIAALYEMSGDFEEAINDAARLAGVKDDVIPVTLHKTTLYAKLENGETVKGEGAIDIPKRREDLKITKVWLKPEALINPRAKAAIQQSDLILLGPGDLFTSIIPNLLVKGVCEAIKSSKAKRAYFCNLQTKIGETKNFGALDFLDTMETYLGKNILDYFIVNSAYDEYDKSFVVSRKNDLKNLKKPKVIHADLMNAKLMHDPGKVMRVVRGLWRLK